jgi:hypothetical protein
MRNILSDHLFGIGKLVAHAQRIKLVQDTLNEHLPPPSRNHCRATSFQNNLLIISASSNAWATRARYLAPDLSRLLQERLALATPPTIRIRVALPPQTTAIHEGRPRFTLSRESAECLRSAAEATTDIELRLALQRLARHVKAGM